MMFTRAEPLRRSDRNTLEKAGSSCSRPAPVPTDAHRAGGEHAVMTDPPGAGPGGIPAGHGAGVPSLRAPVAGKVRPRGIPAGPVPPAVAA
jgi:hypothetical protein